MGLAGEMDASAAPHAKLGKPVACIPSYDEACDFVCMTTFITTT